MELSIQKLTKTFQSREVFRDISFDIPSGSRFAITGRNGAGKSTLLKILSGGMLPSSGSIRYKHAGQDIDAIDLYLFVHFVAPYNTVIEELTLPELFALHRDLGLLAGWGDCAAWIAALDYPFGNDQPVKTFSSGMKQRIRLGLALLDDRPLILLDEPGANLDRQGKAWMHHVIEHLPADRTVIIATNDAEEVALSRQQLSLAGQS